MTLFYHTMSLQRTAIITDLRPTRPKAWLEPFDRRRIYHVPPNMTEYGPMLLTLIRNIIPIGLQVVFCASVRTQLDMLPHTLACFCGKQVSGCTIRLSICLPSPMFVCR